MWDGIVPIFVSTLSCNIDKGKNNLQFLVPLKPSKIRKVPIENSSEEVNIVVSKRKQLEFQEVSCFIHFLAVLANEDWQLSDESIGFVLDSRNFFHYKTDDWEPAGKNTAVAMQKRKILYWCRISTKGAIWQSPSVLKKDQII